MRSSPWATRLSGRSATAASRSCSPADGRSSSCRTTSGTCAVSARAACTWTRATSFWTRPSTRCWSATTPNTASSRRRAGPRDAGGLPSAPPTREGFLFVPEVEGRAAVAGRRKLLGGEAYEQVARLQAEHGGQADQRVEGRVPLAAIDAGIVGDVEPREVGNSLLIERERQAPLAQPQPKNPGGFGFRLRHPSGVALAHSGPEAPARTT